MTVKLQSIVELSPSMPNLLSCFSDAADNITSSSSIICSRWVFLHLGLDLSIFPRHIDIYAVICRNEHFSSTGTVNVAISYSVQGKKTRVQSGRHPLLLLWVQLCFESVFLMPLGKSAAASLD